MDAYIPILLDIYITIFWNKQNTKYRYSFKLNQSIEVTAKKEKKYISYKQTSVCYLC